MSDQNRYDEFHQNIDEFWTYIGKSKYKKKKSAAAKRRAVTNEAAKALSTASTIVVAVVVTMILYVTCLPLNIQPHSADIHVQLYDWVDEEVYYALRQVDGDGLTTVEDGLLQEEKQLLHFENLQDNQSYLLEFFTLQKDGQPRQVGRYEFKTTPREKPDPTVVAISGKAELDGRSANAGEFSFVLSQDGQTVQTATNDLSSSFVFTLPFEAPGTYTYTVSQVAGTAPGVTYDDAVFDITVVVTDVNGQLHANVEAGDIQFANTYVPAPGEVTLSGNVSLTGRPMNTGEFSIVLTQDGQPIQTITNDPDGSFAFTLPFDTAGTYSYSIYQISGTAPGVTYDNAVCEITVTVTDVNGQLQVDVEAGHIQFANTYVPAPTEATVSGNVNLTGRPMNAGEFSFVIAPNGQIMTNDANGVFSFTLPFSAVGTYTYTVSQVIGTAPGVTYDTVAYDITVVVTDLNGQLQATVEAGNIQFANIYVPAPAEATISGNVSLTGRPMNAGEFSFVLTQNGQTVHTVANDLYGEFSFTLPFSAVGTYTYTLQQTRGPAPGVTYDAATFEITIVVTDVNGQLQADVEAGEIKFVNTYVPAPTEATVSGSVSLTGRTINAGEFSFALMQNGQAVQTVTNNANGSFSFTQPFSAVGSYTYTLQQTKGTAPGVTYDTATFNITVVVTDVNGQLQATVEVGEIKFANTYIPAPTEATINGNVSLTGRPINAGEFTVTLSQNGQTVQTVTNDANGGFSFKLTFDTVGSYTYTIQQLQGSAPAVTYDTGVYDVIIEVTDIGGQLQATVNARNTQINNTYTPTPVSTTFSGNIRLSGRTMLANEFTFAVANGSQVIQTVTNDANGGFIFNLTFTAAGTYTYTVYQVAGSDTQITYDTNIFTQTYTVTDNNGVLSLQEDTTRAIFSNIHTPAPITVNIDGIVTLDGAALTAGQFTFVLREGNTTRGQTTNAADGSIRFTQTLSTAGTYTYTITQQEGTNLEMGMRQDLDPIQVIITVTDQNGQLSATQEYSRQEKPVYTLEFWNIYEDLYATASIYGSVSLNDVTSNSIMSPATNRFRFGLYQDGKLVSEIGNGSDGSFYFPELIFRQVGTYNYTVRQIPGSESWIQYDTKEYSVSVTVTYEYGDPMAVMDMYDSSGQYMQTLDFINNYTPPTQTYTFTIPNAPGEGYAIYVYDDTGMQSGTATVRPGMIIEFYVVVPTSTTEINLQVTCNIPGVIVEQVYRYGNEIRFQIVMPAQNVLPENIILTVI